MKIGILSSELGSRSQDALFRSASGAHSPAPLDLPTSTPCIQMYTRVVSGMLRTAAIITKSAGLIGTSTALVYVTIREPAFHRHVLSSVDVTREVITPFSFL